MFARYKVARTQHQSPIWSQDVLACTQIEENQTRRGSHQSEIFSNVKASERWCRPFLTKVIIIAQKCPEFSAIINCMVRTSIDSASLDNKYFLIILRLVTFHQNFGYIVLTVLTSDWPKSCLPAQCDIPSWHYTISSIMTGWDILQ